MHDHRISQADVFSLMFRHVTQAYSNGIDHLSVLHFTRMFYCPEFRLHPFMGRTIDVHGTLPFSMLCSQCKRFTAITITTHLAIAQPRVHTLVGGVAWLRPKAS